MSSTIFDCICGGIATIDMFQWTMGNRFILCHKCGRILKDEGIFGFSLRNANLAWYRFMIKEEGKKAESN